MRLHNYIMEHHKPIIKLHGTHMELHKWVIKLHNSGRIAELHRSCNRHKSLIELHQLIVEIRKSIIELQNSFRIMELHKSIVKIHHWFMDLHTSILGIQNLWMEFHRLVYEDSQFHLLRYIITKTACQLHWRRSHVVWGILLYAWVTSNHGPRTLFSTRTISCL